MDKGEEEAASKTSSFNEFNQLTMADVDSSGVKVRVKYAYDANGNQISEEDGSFISGYYYDDFGQPEKRGDSNFYNEVYYAGGILMRARGCTT
jgi:hypothetical protein